ncbi:hypothetical protein PtA15_7A388 [Puccinia triticina]|uniref:Uncharacterized protein n=1 Tax=Puccinia triticina TaxID=208348 RepID=A0ABY7CSC4_9BASI|nr:uncharacterized protein PtA15_7A388 [Puccinia triticina]WAQ86660.1 hypothetical protein PtA15_7A388 [Puccinia triticina]
MYPNNKSPPQKCTFHHLPEKAPKPCKQKSTKASQKKATQDKAAHKKKTSTGAVQVNQTSAAASQDVPTPGGAAEQQPSAGAVLDEDESAENALENQSSAEDNNLASDFKKPPKALIDRRPRPPTEEQEEEPGFLDLLFGAAMEPKDAKFIPDTRTHEWGGQSTQDNIPDQLGPNWQSAGDAREQ